MIWERIAVIGGGAWGTALAIQLARPDRIVDLWLREPDLVERMRDRRDNPVFLPGITVPDAVRPHAELGACLAVAEVALFVVPSAFARSIYAELNGHASPDLPIVVATKGIEPETLALPLDVARGETGADRPLAVLSGPSFAREVAEGRATALVVAAADEPLRRMAQESFASRSLRLYTNDDPVGVQVAGCLKNVIAIAAGVADSLGMGTNAVAALITRGLAEMARLGAALGGKPGTFAGLAGLGDLVLTCTGDLSRNRRVGQRLGRGERTEDILRDMRAVAEGVRTARSARRLAERHGVSMPIVDEVHRILYKEGSPREALDRLMGRPLTSEG